MGFDGCLECVGIGPLHSSVSRIMSYATLAGFFTQKHPPWCGSPPHSHFTLLPLCFSIFITLPLIPILNARSGRCQSQKMPELSQHQSVVALWLSQLDTPKLATSAPLGLKVLKV